MNFKAEKTDKTNEMKLEFTIDAKIFEDGIQEVFKKSAKYFNIPGFRKGKAPYNIVERTYGKEIFYDKNVDRTTGGFLDVDNKEGGSGAAENIYWENPPKGRYDISLVYYQPAEKSKIAGAGTCMVVVFKQGQSPQTFEVAMSNVKEQKHVTTIEINWAAKTFWTQRFKDVAKWECAKIMELTTDDSVILAHPHFAL